MRSEVTLTTLYLLQNQVPQLPRQCCAVNVSPLLRELILHMVSRGVLRPDAPSDMRLCGVLGDLLEQLRTQPIHLPMPIDPIALRVAHHLRDAPEDDRSLAQLAVELGVSARTLERRFHAETAMTFSDWRRQACLVRALVLLAEGASVTSIALDLGYSPSAFIAMFRNAMGVTPTQYFA
jgi:AraC-like DNA-binding protein